MHKCKEMWKSIVNFLISKLGGITREDHEAALVKHHQYIHFDRRPVQTALVTVEAKWQHEGIGIYEREYLAKELGAQLLKQGFIHFDVMKPAMEAYYPVPITLSRATVRAVAPSSQGFGYEAEGLFIDDPLIHTT